MIPLILWTLFCLDAGLVAGMALSRALARLNPARPAPRPHKESSPWN